MKKLLIILCGLFFTAVSFADQSRFNRIDFTGKTDSFMPEHCSLKWTKETIFLDDFSTAKQEKHTFKTSLADVEFKTSIDIQGETTPGAYYTLEEETDDAYYILDVKTDALGWSAIYKLTKVSVNFLGLKTTKTKTCRNMSVSHAELGSKF